MKRSLQLVATIGSMLVAVGCTSISSTLLTRDVSNTTWEACRLKGVPITLKVPTHLKIVITETKYYRVDSNAGKADDLEISGRTVTHSLIQTDKVFTVDLKRPAAGTLNYTANFQDQYFQSITSNLQDTTIANVSAAIQGILPLFKPSTGAAKTLTDSGPGASSGTKQLINVDSVVAVGIFEIDDPLFENKVAGFLCEHGCLSPEFENCPTEGDADPSELSKIPPSPATLNIQGSPQTSKSSRSTRLPSVPVSDTRN